MSIFGTFSSRRKRVAAAPAETPASELLPKPLRVQVIHIWSAALGEYQDQPHPNAARSLSNRWWKQIHDTMAREKGLFCLGSSGPNPQVQCQEYLINATDRDAADLLSFTFRFIDTDVRHAEPFRKEQCGITRNPDDAIAELNRRFAEQNVGYRFEHGQLVRAESDYLYTEAVRPALSLLRDPDFRGAADEFLRAHEHYRHQRYKEAMTECHKALESTLKTIADARGWRYPAWASAKTLLDMAFERRLIPKELQTHFTGLRSTLEAGVPTLRNRLAGHGQGKNPTAVPAYLAAYALHLTAANILMLARAHRNAE